MKELKHIGLFVDLSGMDELLLRYIKKLDDVFDFESLTLVHFVAMEELPTDISAMLPSLEQSLEEALEEELYDLVEKVFGQKKSTIHVHVYTGGKLDQMIDWVDEQGFDLVLFGKKSWHQGSGIFSSKVVRLTSSNTLFVPETSHPSFGKLVLALDFSDYTPRCVEVTEIIAGKTGARILPVHVLKVGVQYFPYIGNKSELQKGLRKKAETNYHKLQKKTGMDAKMEILEDKEVPISMDIYNYAVRQGAHLIVVGNKGKSDDDDLLIGSVAERLIAHDKHLPVLVVK
ncbi:universal stress protein [Negadavirga shengliensis]|uniref:Universal stress protein n=1 Tax=Negadavirga shengliensis TaxID=1389218 RepID=A0ABV9T495_9BACT